MESRAEKIERLKRISSELRKDVVAMIHTAKAGHPGGSLSAADIVSALYFEIMRIDPQNPSWEDRDRFILSKGHACPILYAALSKRGFFPREHLWTLRRAHTILQGHPDMKKTPGLDSTSGSLGCGLGVGVGMALGIKLSRKSSRIFVMLGDGECQEGAVWEAAMTASHYALDNIYAIVDYNGLQVDGWVKDIMDIEPLRSKWEAFRWHTTEIDGHDMGAILDAFQWCFKVGGPAVVIAHTIKGKGVSFMENEVEWHGLAPSDEELERALEELSREG
ncbi:MAG: transketolase [bacterium]